MARLFLPQRDMAFFSDITKEVVHDVVGQEIILYPISELKTAPHDIYNEAIAKFFDAPIKLGCMVSSEYQEDTVTDQFSVDQKYKIEAYIQWRDLVDRNLDVSIGDYFSYGEILYEVVEKNVMRTIYGQVENKDGIKIIGVKARKDALKYVHKGPTDISYTDPDAVQRTFHQQRGESVNAEGLTGDVRDLRKNDVLEGPVNGPREVSPRGEFNVSGSYTSGRTSSFYDE